MQLDVSELVRCDHRVDPAGRQHHCAVQDRDPAFLAAADPRVAPVGEAGEEVRVAAQVAEELGDALRALVDGGDHLAVLRRGVSGLDVQPRPHLFEPEAAGARDGGNGRERRDHAQEHGHENRDDPCGRQPPPPAGPAHTDQSGGR
jgi:hypothetical protein